MIYIMAIEGDDRPFEVLEHHVQILLEAIGRDEDTDLGALKSGAKIFIEEDGKPEAEIWVYDDRSKAPADTKWLRNYLDEALNECSG